jgi:hypothetical protein
LSVDLTRIPNGFDESSLSVKKAQEIETSATDDFDWGTTFVARRMPQNVAVK